MKPALSLIPAAVSAGLILASCQSAPDEQAPQAHQAAVLDYTLLGIWPERHHVYDISKALKAAGIESTMSGYRPCVLNVETAKLGQALAIVMANPEWQQSRVR